MRFLRYPKRSILFLALLLRMLVFIPSIFHPGSVLEFGYDAYDYHFLASNLDEHGKFSSAEEAPFEPNSARVPVYPFFIALIYSVFGQNRAVVGFIQVILSIFICIITYKIGKKLFNEKVGLIAGLLMALNIGSIGLAPLYQSEILFTFILVSGIYYLIKYLNKPKRNRALIISAALLGVATLCRSISLFLPFIIIPAFFLLKLNFLKKLKISLIFITVFFMIITSWVYRNYLTFGYFFFTSSIGLDMLMGPATEIEADIKNENYYTLHREMVDKYGAGPIDKYNRLTIKEKALLAEKRGYYFKEAFKIIKAHPLIFLKKYLLGRFYVCFLPLHGTIFVNLWGDDDGTDFFAMVKALPMNKVIPEISRDRKNWPKLLIITYGLLYTIVVYTGVGLSFARVERKSMGFFLLLSMIIYFLLLSFTFLKALTPRFRFPIMPFVAILSAIGLLGRRRGK